MYNLRLAINFGLCRGVLTLQIDKVYTLSIAVVVEGGRVVKWLGWDVCAFVNQKTQSLFCKRYPSHILSRLESNQLGLSPHIRLLTCRIAGFWSKILIFFSGIRENLIYPRVWSGLQEPGHITAKRWGLDLVD